MTLMSDISKIIQGSEEWHALRRGKLTGSRIADIIRPGRGKDRSTAYLRYMADIILERMTDRTAPRIWTAAMERGSEVEAKAVLAYEFYRNVETTTVAFIDHPRIANAGVSPDRLVGDIGLCEVKCPETHTHIQTLITGIIDPDYLHQMQWEMACSGRVWNDFVSYDDRLPPPLDIFIKRVPRDPAAIVRLETAAREFLDDIEQTIAKLTTIRSGDRK